MTKGAKFNRPGAATNPFQHLVDQPAAPASGDKVRQTGTASSAEDVADPHPSDEEHPYEARHPGGANPPSKDVGPNNAAHDGEAPRRPDNASTSPRE